MDSPNVPKLDDWCGDYSPALLRFGENDGQD